MILVAFGLLSFVVLSQSTQQRAFATRGTPLGTSQPFTFVEDFTNTAGEDADGSGASWGVPDGLGGAMVVRGVGGGPGSLGPLHVPAGTTVELSTDTEDFSGIVDPAIYDPANQVRPRNAQNTPIVVTGGVFAFESLVIEPGAALRFVGSKPVRLYVRGRCEVGGTLDVSGFDALDHLATECLGGVGGIAGPGGGAGGPGGDRPPTDAFQNTGIDGDVVVGGAPPGGCTPFLYADVDGKGGQGVPVPDALSPVGSAGGGGGGVAWPQPLGGSGLSFPDHELDLSGQEYDPFFGCRIKAPGSPGGGGANALDGEVADLRLPAGFSSVQVPPEAEGGASDAIVEDPAARDLDPLRGHLRGGAGGGGGGGHLQDSRVNGFAFIDCSLLGPGVAAPLRIVEYVASSSAGGGGGGGALQLQAGRRLEVNGVVDARGGVGGSDDVITFPTESPAAMPGGGGAGGSVLLQSPQVVIAQIPARVDVRGGDGGVGTAASRGGRGGPGFLRVESIPALTVADLAPIDCPSGPLGCQEPFFSNSPVFPDPDALQNPFLFPTGTTPDELYGTGEFTTDELGVGRLSGSLSCWIRPPGSYSALAFPDDGLTPTGGVVAPGWDLDLVLLGQSAPLSYRRTSPLLGGASLEQLFRLVQAPPIVVRFQAARLAGGAVPDACDVDLAGPASPIVPGSLTPWVEHAFELDDLNGQNPALAPNAFRYQLCFDSSDLVLNAVVLGIGAVRVEVDRL